MMTYRYLVGYVTESKYGAQRIGASIIDRSKPIVTAKDVEEAETELKKDFDVDKVILLSFSELRSYQ